MDTSCPAGHRVTQGQKLLELVKHQSRKGLQEEDPSRALLVPSDLLPSPPIG